MTDAELVTRQKRDWEWRQTEIGRLFYAYENAHGVAWAKDAESGFSDSVGADRRADAAWKKQKEARAAFLLALRGFD